MRGYAEKSLLTNVEIALLRRATALVDRVGDELGTVRCHELARAVGRVLDLEVQDGSYGFVEHSWLWTTPFPKDFHEEQVHLGFPNILDVYTPGQVPMVQLLVCGEHGALPHVGWSYRPAWRPRTDVDWVVVDELESMMRTLS